MTSKRDLYIGEGHTCILKGRKCRHVRSRWLCRRESAFPGKLGSEQPSKGEVKEGKSQKSISYDK